MTNKGLTFIILFAGLFGKSLAQSPIHKYVIITFEDVYKQSQHGVKSYYWIVNQDSIKSPDFKMSFLFLSNFSKSDLIDCCNGKDIDPLAVFQNRSDGIFDQTYYKKLEQLKLLIKTKRIRLQTIRKNWQSGQQEVITVFATSIQGNFCSSNFHVLGQQRYGYKGKVFIPNSSFTYSDDFLNSKDAKLILNQDFSKRQFDIISY